ncbi:hypothetical protein [Cohnella abietis]|uniref:Uncharacterized protein n=1 Tax=Cohnella abietis TaxID=2507935 RepID=A0A3T1D285_9BACL|nr:hypothetical protein [Cohnella abietis]BBI32168.1 hypothetical protein KCTCHS21_15670 [Cohnella abietis]
METFELSELVISQGSEVWNLSFSSAKLMIVSEYGSRLWFIDVEGLSDEALLNKFAESDEIGVSVQTATIEGRKMDGRAFFHPNPQHHAAAIRGDGPLQGYEQPLNSGKR